MRDWPASAADRGQGERGRKETRAPCTIGARKGLPGHGDPVVFVCWDLAGEELYHRAMIVQLFLGDSFLPLT